MASSGKVSETYQELYVLSKHWQSDLEFFHDELRFFKNLNDKYAVWLTNQDNVFKVSSIRTEIANLDFRQKALDITIKNHTILLEDQLMLTDTISKKVLREEHERLGAAFAFRDLKREVFTVTADVFASENFPEFIGRE